VEILVPMIKAVNWSHF